MLGVLERQSKQMNCYVNVSALILMPSSGLQRQSYILTKTYKATQEGLALTSQLGVEGVLGAAVHISEGRPIGPSGNTITTSIMIIK